MKRARFTKLARAEFLAQVIYYEKQRVGLGAKFRKEVEAIAELAALFPSHGKSAAGGTRRRLVPDFPYKLFYTETNYGVLIHAVAADQREPEYWLNRLHGDG